MVEELTAELFKKIKDELPDTAKISDIRFEGAEIVLYTKSKDFFTGDSTPIKELVGKFKKRIMLRPDPSLCLDMEDAKKEIERLVPKEAVLRETLFEPEFGTVTLEAEKPGLVIGKGGETLREIKRATLWAPVVRRAPLTPSDVIKVLRDMLYRESAFRKEYLDKVGKRIHSGWKQTDWLTLTALGGFRE
ncbi:MAG: beta-CASP ribonuclease aCPSF1, partial [Candidatus Aenigmatarchaeota archaeon]